jgi:hypothetical protein
MSVQRTRRTLTDWPRRSRTEQTCGGERQTLDVIPSNPSVADAISAGSAETRQADLVAVALPLRYQGHFRGTSLAEAFAPRRIEQSLTALQDAQPDHTPAVEATRRTIAECERKLARHRAALEAGADPALVVAWSREVQRQRTVAKARLANLTSHHSANRPMSRDDIHAMVDTLGGLLNALRHADPADKTQVYRELGVHLTYNHTEHTILAETRPTSSVCVVLCPRGDLTHIPTLVHRADLQLP